MMITDFWVLWDELIRYKKIELVAQFVYSLAVVRADGLVAGATFRLPTPRCASAARAGTGTSSREVDCSAWKFPQKESADGVAR
jgi:hypothetical protein